MNPTHESTMSIATSPAISSPRLGRSRTQSMSSDHPSIAAYSLLSPPLSVSPEAGFIAASAASQIITNDHDTHSALWYDQHGIEPSDETAIVSPAALQLVNNFLDQILFNTLSKARSTSLSALRPAVAEVLKPKLAKDAINQADEELHEYLGGGDEDDLLQAGADSPQDWDLELVWKRTRLRCMVYSSLGDMEEEDEDYYMEQEGFDLGGNGETLDVISPAVAIFLTSILEYMGEQALVIAGQGAYHRLQSRLVKEIKSGSRDPHEVADRVVVDELDMDRVALDRTLGRLWRAWKKRIRSPTFDSRPYSRGSARSSHFRQTSIVPSGYPLHETSTVDEADCGSDDKVAEPLPDEQTMASSIPLPIGERDVDEIEVPGLVYYSDEEDTEDDESEQSISKRPQSMLLLRPWLSPAPTNSTLPRKRSNSVPGLGISTFSHRVHRTDLAKDAEDPEATEPVARAAPVAGVDSEGEEYKSAPESSTDSVGVPETDQNEATAEPKTTHDRANDGEEDEHFEILTTSRVSISGGTSPSIPDSDHSRSSSQQATRPASISSPRLIEVAGPKSPVGRSPTTREAPDAFPPQAALDGRHRAHTVETIFRSPISTPTSRSPAERPHQLARHPSTSISGVEEGPGAFPLRKSATLPTPPSGHVPPPVEHVRVPPIKQSHAVSRYPSRHHGPPSPIQEHVHTRREDSNPHGQSSPEPHRRDAVPNRSYPLHAQDRAARQQAAGSGAVAVERSVAKPDASDATRQIHTSGSSVSSATSRLKPVRTSEESGSTRPEDVARNFEELIQSDQTIQYTLTPESMRGMDSSSLNGGPVAPTKSRKSDDVKRFNRSRSPSNAGSSEDKRSQPGVQQNGSSMHSLSPKKSTFSGPVPRAPKNGASPSIGSRSQVQARDARVPSDSMGDFAQFIRATGPAGDNNIPSPLRTTAPPSIASAQNSVDTRTSTASSRARLQARNAAVDKKEDHSDLIDFIRRGPTEHTPGTHRIPRAVAPFRNTMDSDQLSAAVGGRAVDASIPDLRYSQVSTTATDMTPSMHSSVNSQSALLKKKTSLQMADTVDENEPMQMPVRKTRRVKDPYAIDFSDEEDEEVFAKPSRPPVKKEESLAEFLMNYEPPPEATPAPPAPPAQKSPARTKKKSSASNLINRFRGGSSSNHSNAPPVPPLPRTGTASSGKGFVPIQVNMPPGYDKQAPVDRGAPPRTAPSAGGVPRKKYEARDPMVTSAKSGTSDLAAFLKSSEPPASGPVRPAHSPPEEQGNAVSRMLGRRKKSMIA